MTVTCRITRCLPTFTVAVLLVGMPIDHPALSGATVAKAAGPAAWTDDLTPIPPAEWSYDRAAHLLERAGFGGTPDDVTRLAAMTPQQAVARLVDYELIDNSGVKPFDESGIWDPGMDPFPESRADAVRIAREHGEGLGEKLLPEGS